MSAVNSPTTHNAEPQISFAVACYNAQPYLTQAIESALAQRDVSVEVLVVDDGSRDSSLETARALAAADPRVRVFTTPENGGPAAARNVALDNMRGEWFAILDSDDWIDPERSRTLLDIAQREGADLVADNLLVFGDGIETHPFLGDADIGSGRWVELGPYFVHSELFGKRQALGYLKPMIRADALRRHKIRYNENLRIAEDDELIVQLLSAGCRYFLTPLQAYHYRKHPQSISHRLSLVNAERMLAAEKGIRDMIGPRLANAPEYRARYASIERGVAFVSSIERLKERRLWAALSTLLNTPSAIALYRMPIMARIERFLGRG